MLRVADQSVTMHAALRDKYHQRARFLEAILILASILLGTFALADFGSLGLFSLEPIYARVIMAVSSALVFFGSILIAKVDWKAKGDEHGRACRSYARFKAKCQALPFQSDTPDASLLLELSREYASLGQTCIPIPDECFAALKAAHKRKVFLSKCLDSYPCMSIPVMKFVLWLKHTIAAIRHRQSQEAAATEENCPNIEN